MNIMYVFIRDIEAEHHDFQQIDLLPKGPTLPETNISRTWKPGWLEDDRFPSGARPVFRLWFVSFREGNSSVFFGGAGMLMDVCPPRKAFPEGKHSIPTIHFQVARNVGFREAFYVLSF